MKYRYTAEAEAFIEMLPKFDRNAFERWVDSLVLQVGSNNILQYIEEKKRWNARPVLRGPELKCDFSKQARNVINQLTEFDEAEFKIWFNNAVEMSKGDIHGYLEQLR